MNSTSVPYTVISCSSSDKAYPITAIQNASFRSNGWLTAPNPVYPIEFIIDLGEQIEIETVQFVSHQSKIPSRVDLSYSLKPSVFQPLGSFQFSDNSQTNYTARELKSVTLSHVSAQFIKINIRGCHLNVNNTTNQSGLVSLKVMGKGNVSKPQTPITSSRPMETDIEQLIDLLERQKKDAVLREEFAEANNIKAKLSHLKDKRDELVQLQKAKADSIQKEDYDAAREYKRRIDALMGDDFNDNRPKTQQKAPKVEVREIPSPQVIRKTAIPEAKKETDEDLYKDPPIIIDDNIDMGDERPLRPAEHALSGDSEEESDFVPPPRVVKPVSKPKKIEEAKVAPPKKVIEKSAPPMDGSDPLLPENRQEATPLVNKVGEELIRQFFSKNWDVRLQGVQNITQKLMSVSRESILPLFNNFCYILSYRINESQKQIVLAAIRGIQIIADNHGIQGQELSKAVNQLISPMATKIGGAQQQITDAVCEFFVWLTQMQCSDIVLPIIMGDPKKQVHWKASLAKIHALRDMVLLHSIDSLPGLTLETVMQASLPHIESPKAEVRQAVIELIINLQQIAGPAITKHLNKLPQRIRKEIEKGISKDE